jgi:hypothetical protein
MKRLGLCLITLCLSCSSFNSEKKPVDWEEIAELNGHHYNEDETHHEEKHVKVDRTLAAVKSLPVDNCSDQTREERETLDQIIGELGGTNIDSTRYEKTVEGFQEYLRDAGVTKYFSAKEILKAHSTSASNSCYGGNYLIPSQCRWPSALAQVLMATKMRVVVNKPIKVRNWWRPSCYNTKVSGAKRSDHIQARGFDLDFPTGKDRAKAQKFLCEFYKDKGELSLQTGIGCNTLHIGIGSPKRLSRYPADGSRFWKYGSINRCELKRLEGDDCWKQGRDGKLYIHTHEGSGAL